MVMNNAKDLIAGDKIACKGQMWTVVEEYYNPENLVHYFKVINETGDKGQVVTGQQIYSLLVATQKSTSEARETEKCRR